jgi:hypothetical protein
MRKRGGPAKDEDDFGNQDDDLPVNPERPVKPRRPVLPVKPGRPFSEEDFPEIVIFELSRDFFGRSVVTVIDLATGEVMKFYPPGGRNWNN